MALPVPVVSLFIVRSRLLRMLRVLVSVVPFVLLSRLLRFLTCSCPSCLFVVTVVSPLSGVVGCSCPSYLLAVDVVSGLAALPVVVRRCRRRGTAIARRDSAYVRIRP